MFLVRPIPRKYEHLLAYMLRVSWLNHFRCLRDLMVVCGLHNLNHRIAHRKLVNGLFDISVLASWLNVDKDLLTPHAIDTSKKFTDYFGQKVPTCMLNFSAPNFCTECLLESGYLNPIGAIKPYSYCTKHHISSPLKWDDGSNIKWNSHYFWRKTHELSLQRSPLLGEVELNEAIHQLYQGNCNSKLDKPLHLLELSDLLLLLRFIVKFDGKLKKVSSINSTQTWVNAFNKLLNWPADIHKLFSSYEKNPMSNKGKGIRATYRDLYDELYSSSFSSSYAYLCLRQAYEEYVSRPCSLTPLWSTNCKLLPDACINKVSSSFLIKELAIRERGLQRLLDLKLIKPDVITESGVMLFDKQVAENFILKYKSLANLSRVCQLLRVSRSVATKLADSGFLPYIARPSENWRDWIFDIVDIADSIQSLKRKANSAKNKDTSSIQPFRANNFRGESAAEIVTNMQTGKLPFEFIPNSKHPLSLDQFRPIPVSNSNVISKRHISPEQAAIDLKININAIYEFIKLGLLEAEKVFTKVHTRKVLLIHKHSLAEFKKRFVLKPISKQGLIGISGPRINGGIVNVYQRISGGCND